jgi:hypothetical protein
MNSTIKTIRLYVIADCEVGFCPNLYFILP